MPSKNAAQHGLMAMAATRAGRRRLMAEGKNPPPENVAEEYLRADRGRHFSKMRKGK